MTERRPQRVRVVRTVPLRGRVASPPRSPEVVSVYDRDLRRAQLRWSLGSLLVVVVPLLGLPLLGVLAPAVAALPVLGVPLAWVLLALVVYPVIWVVGRWHVQGAERTEAEYRQLVGDDDATADRPPGAPAPSGGA